MGFWLITLISLQASVFTIKLNFIRWLYNFLKFYSDDSDVTTTIRKSRKQFVKLNR